MRTLLLVSALLIVALLMVGCASNGTGTQAGADGGTSGTQSTGTGTQMSADSATASDFDNPAADVVEPGLDATDEEFALPA